MESDRLIIKWFRRGEGRTRYRDLSFNFAATGVKKSHVSESRVFSLYFTSIVKKKRAFSTASRSRVVEESTTTPREGAGNCGGRGFLACSHASLNISRKLHEGKSS